MPAIRTTPTVRWLLIINVIAFLSQLVLDKVFGAHIMETFGLIPQYVSQRGYYWQFLTYIFLHADMMHILFNMLVVWMIGSELEAQWGAGFFLRYYLICGVSGGLLYFIVQGLFRGVTADVMVGSSGAVYGLLVAYGIIYSERILLFMMVFPMKAKYFVLLLAAVEFISTVFYSGSAFANAAHLGGMVVGFSYLFLNAWLRMRLKSKKSPNAKRKLRKSHLRLVVDNEVLSEFEQDQDQDDDDSGKPTIH